MKPHPRDKLGTVPDRPPLLWTLLFLTSVAAAVGAFLALLYYAVA